MNNNTKNIYNSEEALQDKLSEMFHKYGVPDSGKADNQAGEMIRAICRLRYRYYNDGDHINIDYGKETCNAAARYLKEKGNHKIRAMITDLFENPYSYNDEEYKDFINDLAVEVIEDIEANPGLATVETIDMFDCYDPDEDQETYDEDEDW